MVVTFFRRAVCKILAKVNIPYVDLSVHFSQSLCDVHLFHFVSLCYFAFSFLLAPLAEVVITWGVSTGSPSVYGRKPECPLYGGSRPCPSRADTTECSSHVDSSRRLLSSWRCRFGSSAVGRVARNPLNHLLMVGSRCWYFPQWDDRVCAENWIEASLVVAYTSRHISMETSCSGGEERRRRPLTATGVAVWWVRSLLNRLVTAVLVL